MPHSLNITIAQVNFTIGAIKHNQQKIINIYQQITQTANAIIPDLLVFSELALPGYPAEDLYLQPNFQNKMIDALEELKALSQNNSCAMLIGALLPSDNNKAINAAYLIKNGEISYIASKTELPNYGVFDDQRLFTSFSQNKIININNYKIAVMICEDMWHEDIPNSLSSQGAQILLAMNASPFNIEKDQKRKLLAQKICTSNDVDLVYVNQIGGQDELIFDGGSFVCNSYGDIVVQLDYFIEEQLNIAWDNNQITTIKQIKSLSKEEQIYQALVLGLKDYAHKNSFTKVLLGLSGGIDSALTAAIAVDALGAENVISVMLPSQYTSESSTTDATLLAKDLNIELLNLPIEQIAQTTRIALSPIANLISASIADQNIQARIRGLLLMGLSNQFDYLLLSTGNKSENAIGYATLYGDMCGGYNVLKDVYKTQVYELANWRKLPSSIIKKAPSAELHSNQKDQDNLPDYDILDKILFHLIEENLSIKDTISKGYDAQLVEKIFNLLKNSEYKRKQSCLGPIISTCSLSRDRRYPVTNHFSNN